MELMIPLTPAQQPAMGAPLRIAVLLGVVLLSGCGASLNSDTASSFSAKTQTSSTPLAAKQETESQTAPTRVADTSNRLPSTSAPTSGSASYRIGPPDVLEISVFKVPELSKSVQVAEGGTINLPLVGEIPAAGMTAQEVERDLTLRLGAKYLQNPQVTVYVKEYNSQRVTIEGAVKKPGVYPIRGKATLLQLIATAEGLDANADSTVLVIRQADGNRSAARFELSEIRTGWAEDPPMRPGDTIVVGTSAIKETFNNILKILPGVGTFALLL
jgi:polysaccharide biosynthesis/export protein